MTRMPTIFASRKSVHTSWVQTRNLRILRQIRYLYAYPPGDRLVFPHQVKQFCRAVTFKFYDDKFRPTEYILKAQWSSGIALPHHRFEVLSSGWARSTEHFIPPAVGR
ncbi:hypothetical protein TNCV_347091 [Trichonephila clavipes]|nr:hypothetical protein TNCV_347091 [Trichonephila clavipes]